LASLSKMLAMPALPLSPKRAAILPATTSSLVGSLALVAILPWSFLGSAFLSPALPWSFLAAIFCSLGPFSLFRNELSFGGGFRIIVWNLVGFVSRSSSRLSMPTG